MIVQTTDWRALAWACGDDLAAWDDRWREFDWPAMLETMTLLTDTGGRAWCLVERHDARLIEAHVCILPRYRGAVGLALSREMLDWIDKSIPHDRLLAKAKERRTQVYLRLLGFELDDVRNGTAYFFRQRGSLSATAVLPAATAVARPILR